MAMEEKSIFEELAPYAKMIVVPGVTVGNLTYSNQQDLYSTSVFTLPAAAAGVVPANTTVSFFQGALGESAIQQGYAGGVLSLAQTNNKFSKGQAPANQVYIATHAGFSLSKLSSSTDLSSGLVLERLLGSQTVALPATGAKCDVFSMSQNFSWDLTIGAGITRTIGTLAEYHMPGVSAVTDEGQGPTVAPLPVTAGAPTDTVSAQLGSPWSDMKRLQVPIVFPPLVKVQITAQNGSPFALIDTAIVNNVQIKMVLRGYLMTMPVG